MKYLRPLREIVGSNTTRGIGMSVCIYSVLVLSCVGSGFAMGLSPSNEAYHVSATYSIVLSTTREATSCEAT
jgi:hypothetical protein